MNPFTYISTGSPEAAVAERAANVHASYLAGGTNLLDEIKLNVIQPDRLIDVRKVGLDKIEQLPGGGLRIGAGVTNSNLAYDPEVLKNYPVLSQAILAGASPQLRNMATTAGNLLQHTRCYYYRDVYGTSPCNKRQPGSGCAALDGYNRIHAILGTSEKCIATHPSDMDVALVALDTVLRVRSAAGERTIPIADFYVAYGEDPSRENVLQSGELITAADLPAARWFARSCYVKARDRASYEFALSSAAVAVDMDAGTIRDCRVALGGVATKPWRALAAEKVLKGNKATDAAFDAAITEELKAAIPRKFNAFKIELTRRVLVSALKQVTTLA